MNDPYISGSQGSSQTHKWWGQGVTPEHGLGYVGGGCCFSPGSAVSLNLSRALRWDLETGFLPECAMPFLGVRVHLERWKKREQEGVGAGIQGPGLAPQRAPLICSRMST